MDRAIAEGEQKDSGEGNDRSRYERAAALPCARRSIQSPRATEIIERRFVRRQPGFLSLVSVLEVAWVLKSLFKRSRQEIANDIEMLLAADTIEVQNEQEVYNAVVSLRNGIRNIRKMP